MVKSKTTTMGAAEIVHERFFKGKPAMEALLEHERINGEVAMRIYELRTQAGMTQHQLAQLVGTTPSVISRLEDANYTGHSLTMLQRIAVALKRRLRIQFEAPDTKQKSKLEVTKPALARPGKNGGTKKTTNLGEGRASPRCAG